MRTIHCWSLALVLVLGCSTLAVADDIHWQTDLDSARRIAAQNNRLILVHFWAPWCPPCRRLEQTVFQQQGVGPALEANYVLVKINLDEHPQLQKQFDIRTIPCDVILTPQGRVVDKVQSKQTAQEYVSQMAQVAATATNRPAMTVAQNSPSTQFVSQPATQPGGLSAGYCAVPGAPAVAEAKMQAPLTASPSLAQATPSQPKTETLKVSAPTTTPAAPQYGNYWSQPTPANPALSKSTAAPQVAAPSNPFTGWSSPTSTAPSSTPVASAPMQNNSPAIGQNGLTNQPSIGASPYGGLSIPAASPSSASVAATPAQGNIAQPSLMQQPQQPISAAPAQPKTPPLGLDGFCPVTLCEGEVWTKGDLRWGVIHRGRLYLFASPEHQQRFWANPDRYSPVAAGQDPVMALDQGQTIEGRREHGVFFEGRVYLFATEGSLQRFSQAPQRYASEITAAMNRR